VLSAGPSTLHREGTPDYSLNDQPAVHIAKYLTDSLYCTDLLTEARHMSLNVKYLIQLNS